MNIKELTYNNVAKDRKTGIGMAVFILIGMTYFITLHFYINHQLALGSFLLVDQVMMIGLLFVVLLMSAFWYTVSENDLVKYYDENYAEHLSQYSISVLRKATESPELDDETKQVITAHLNSNNPGWSLEGVTQ